MFNSDKIRLLLVESFAHTQARNPRYSMRSFAKKLGVSQAALSQVLSGKRPLTKKAAEKILSGLDKNPLEISELLSASVVKPVRENAYTSLDMDAYHLISDWYYYAILSLAHTEGFKSSPKWIASRLGISEKMAHDAIERLLRLDMLAEDSKGRLLPTEEHFEAISAIASPALRKANRQNLELATKALEEIDLEKRDFTAITLCFDPDRMDEARSLIKKFRRQFDKTMESGTKKEVYKLTIQLFPLSK